MKVSNFLTLSVPDECQFFQKRVVYTKRSLKVPQGHSDNTMAKRKSTNNDPQNTTQKTKIDQHEPHYKQGVNSGAPEEYTVPAPQTR